MGGKMSSGVEKEQGIEGRGTSFGGRFTRTNGEEKGDGKHAHVGRGFPHWGLQEAIHSLCCRYHVFMLHDIVFQAVCTVHSPNACVILSCPLILESKRDNLGPMPSHLMSHG